MRKILVLFFFVLAFGKVQAQDLLPPYKLEKIKTYELLLVKEGRFFSKDSVNYLMKKPYKVSKYNVRLEIISPKTKKVYSKISVHKNFILDNYLIKDLDADSTDELVFCTTGNNKLNFYLFDSGNISEIYSINIPKRNYNGDVLLIPAQLDNDKPLEVIFVLSTNMPQEGSIRGAFAIDLQTKKIIWKKLFADYISAFLTFNKAGKDYLALFSYGRSFHFYRAYGKFWVLRNSPKKQDYSYLLKAPDFSSDTSSYMKIFEIKSGKEIYKKRIGGKGVKVVNMHGKLNGYVGALKIMHILIYDNIADKVVGFRKKDFALVDISEFAHNPINKVVSYGSRSIVQTSDSTLGVIYKGDFKIFKINFPEFSKVSEFIESRYGPIFIGSKINEGVLFNLRQKVIATAPLRISYIKNSGDLFLQHTKFNSIFKTNLFQLKKQNLFERLTSKAYLLFFIVLLGMLLLLTGAWMTTLFFAFRKISIQNKQLQMTTSKLLMAEKLSALGLISGNIAHQINSPLGVILNAATRLGRKITDPNINLILEAGKRIQTTVNKFLVTTRYDEEEKKGVTFSEVFNNWYDLFSLDFRNQQVEIVKNIKEENVCLNLTSNELNEIINNLMFNARDSVIKSNDAERIIEISTRRDRDVFEITIEDNGSGFDDKILKRGIKLFVTTKEKGEGTGLGLWIITNILKNSNGNIVIENTDKGAKVTVRVPIKENCYDDK